ncbi:MAG: reverse transcriptase domain-containing protein [Candidatus Nanoarchaeia archaeon]
MFTIQDVYNAYLQCRRGKKSSNLFEFEMNLERNIFSIYEELQSNSYYIHNSFVFVLTYPKVREIWAVDIRDRIVHHLVISYLEQYYEHKTQLKFSANFLQHSHACRKGKGSHKLLREVKELYRTHKYYLQLDISSFFVSIDRTILFSILEQDFSQVEFEGKTELFELLRRIIFHKYTQHYTTTKNAHLLKTIPTFKSLIEAEKHNCGLPIGNLTSQFFANVYLNTLDYYITQELGYDAYCRYMDDFVLFTNTREELEALIESINSFLSTTLHLELASGKIRLRSTSEYLDFIGYIIHNNYTLVRKKSVKECRRRLYEVLSKNQYLDIKTQKLVMNSFNSYLGHFKYANTYKLTQSLYKKMDLNNYFTLTTRTDDEGNQVSAITRTHKQEQFKNFSEQYEYFVNKYSNTIILIQMGSFYRIFDSQAVFLQQQLGLKLFVWKERICCGFPISNKNMIAKVKDLGHNYAVVVEKDMLANGLKERIESDVFENAKSFSHTFDTQELLNNISKSSHNYNFIEEITTILRELDSLSPYEVYCKLHTIRKTMNSTETNIK